MTDKNIIATADRVSRRRARTLLVLGILFLAGQPIYFAHSGAHAAQVKTALWMAWAMALLAALAWAGGHFHGRAVHALVEDEVAPHNRLRAYATGFWAAMLGAVAMYGVSLIDNLKGREAVHIILTLAVGAALVRFGLLERRALADD